MFLTRKKFHIHFTNQSGNQTWILLKGCGGLPDSMLEFSNVMGLLHFTEPVLMNAEVQGTFIYPDWVTCVEVSSVKIK